MRIRYDGVEEFRAEKSFGFDIQEWDEADFAIFLTLFGKTRTWFVNRGNEPVVFEDDDHEELGPLQGY